MIRNFNVHIVWSYLLHPESECDIWPLNLGLIGLVNPMVKLDQNDAVIIKRYRFRYINKQSLKLPLMGHEWDKAIRSRKWKK